MIEPPSSPQKSSFICSITSIPRCLHDARHQPIPPSQGYPLLLVSRPPGRSPIHVPLGPQDNALRAHKEAQGLHTYVSSPLKKSDYVLDTGVVTLLAVGT